MSDHYPRIGITGYHVRGEEGFGGKLRGVSGQGFSVIGHDYINSVHKEGGIPFRIPVFDVKHCKRVVESVDGLLVSGGEDVNPRLYGEHLDLRSSSLSPERDLFELALIDEALKQKKPLLCICRGIQLLNVYFGGTLYKDVRDYSPDTLAHQFDRVPRWYMAHRVKLISPVLQQMYNAGEIETNSYHHQAVRELGDGLQVAAVAEDGIIEGLCHPDHPQLLALQWHPEMMAAGELEEGLIPFRWLVNQCLAK